MKQLSRRDFLKLLALGAGAAYLTACAPKGFQSPPDSQNEPGNGFVRVRGKRFIDADGRELLINAVNVYRNSDPADLNWVKEWGFNGVRLVIFWSFIEPKMNQIDNTELERIAALVEKAAELGLYVIIDMHQDLWSAKPEDDWGRGAPSWTWENNARGHAHDESGVWSMAYFESDKIQYQFDRFWNNAPLSDGVGLMDHWLKIWELVATRFADYKNVVGYDLFNEPFWGSRVTEPMESMTIAMLPWLIAEHGFGVVDKPAFELALLGMEKAQSNPKLYNFWLNAGRKKAQKLDQELLVPAWDKAAQTIREADSNHIIFSGPTLPANFGLETGIRPVQDANGNRDAQYAFSAHVYDDDPLRMKTIIGHIAEHAEDYQTPLFLGEWGNLTNGDNIFAGDPLEATRVMLRALDDFGASRSYWHFLDAREQFEWFDEFLQRPYPAVLSGQLQNFNWDFENASFTCEWTDDPSIKAPSLFYLPFNIYQGNFHVSLEQNEGGSGGIEYIPTTGDSKNIFVLVKPSGTDAKHKIVITRSP